MNENRRCSIRFHLLVPGGRWQTVMLRPSSLANACSSRFHRRYPSAVTAAAIGGDQQATGLRIAGTTHAVPPAADRIDGETGSIVVDAATHPPRVTRDVIA